MHIHVAFLSSSYSLRRSLARRCVPACVRAFAAALASLSLLSTGAQHVNAGEDGLTLPFQLLSSSPFAPSSLASPLAPSSSSSLPLRHPHLHHLSLPFLSLSRSLAHSLAVAAFLSLSLPMLNPFALAAPASLPAFYTERTEGKRKNQNQTNEGEDSEGETIRRSSQSHAFTVRASCPTSSPTTPSLPVHPFFSSRLLSPRHLAAAPPASDSSLPPSSLALLSSTVEGRFLRRNSFSRP